MHRSLIPQFWEQKASCQNSSSSTGKLGYISHASTTQVSGPKNKYLTDHQENKALLQGTKITRKYEGKKKKKKKGKQRTGKKLEKEKW